MEKKYFDLIVKDLSGEISEIEKIELKSWLPGNEHRYNELKELWEKSYSEEEFSVNEEAGWDNLLNRIKKSERRKNLIFQPYFQVAASIVAILSIAFIFYNRKTTSNNIISSNGHIEIFYLPDSTQVWLNKNSTLTIEKFGNYERRVQLIGEAYFKVKKDPQRPFVILAGNSITKVLGTEFDLKAYPGKNIEIDVESGKVEFRNIVERSSTIFLVEDEQGVLDKSSGQVKRITKTFVEDKWLAKTSSSNSSTRLAREISHPQEYLQHQFNWRDNIVRQVVIEGEVMNKAIFTSYKNIRIKATYYTGNNKVSVDYYDLSKDLKPGQFIKYKFRLGNWFRKASKVEVKIEDAHSIQ